MPDFQRLEQEIYQAAKAAFTQLAERGYPEPICTFALYNDEGAMTVCPAANTVAHPVTGAFPSFGQPRYDPATVAHQLFEKAHPELERQTKAAITDMQTYTADLNGDG